MSLGGSSRCIKSNTVTISGQGVLFCGQKPASQPCAFLVSKLAHTTAPKDDIGILEYRTTQHME
jgi:hypothetical protein